MEKVCYSKAVTGGHVQLPPSKSAAHRALICAALSGGACAVSPIEASADMQATFALVRALGGTVDYDGTTAHIGPGPRPRVATLNCGESGSTLRFAIPIFAALGISCTFSGEGRLPQRPIGVYTEILKGVRTEGDGLPYGLCGQLQGGDFSLPGNISSQFITGLLLALPLLQEDSRILLTTPLESGSYVQLTLHMLAQFGVQVIPLENGYCIPGGQRYTPRDYEVEGDWSQCAFFLSMAAFCKEPLILQGLDAASWQGDKQCVAFFAAMGVQVHWESDCLVAYNAQVDAPFHGLRGIEIFAEDMPDAVPALAVTAALCQGETHIRGAARLRIKESDRLMAVANLITALGGKARETADGLVITGVPALTGGFAQGYNDHRIVMAAAAAVGGGAAKVELSDPLSIRKSYPSFFTVFNQLGGIAHVVHVGE